MKHNGFEVEFVRSGGYFNVGCLKNTRDSFERKTMSIVERTDAMASVNLYPTFNYSQPEDYRFSHDSVFLARRVFEIVRDSGAVIQSALDLCAGCGIIGLDYLYHCQSSGRPVPLLFDFIEVQESYHSHFETNWSRLDNRTTQVQFINENYETLLKTPAQRRYDLIVCNPPYFFEGHGKYPDSELKKRSRFFVDSDLPHLVQFIQSRLTTDGSAFILARDQDERNIDLKAVIYGLGHQSLSMESLSDIRGTGLIKLQLLPG